MIIGMPTTSRSQQRYDHRLRDLVQRTGDLSFATDLGVPRSTARGWLGAAPRAVVSLDVAHLTELELRQEILKLRRRVKKLAALLRLALALLHASGFRLSGERLPDVPAKLRILRAVDRARECMPLRAVLRFLGLSPRRFQAWRQRQTACALDDQSSCPHTLPVGCFYSICAEWQLELIVLWFRSWNSRKLATVVVRHDLAVLRRRRPAAGFHNRGPNLLSGSQSLAAARALVYFAKKRPSD